MAVGLIALAVIYFIALLRINRCVHALALVFLYFCKNHSTSILKLLETQILKNATGTKNA